MNLAELFRVNAGPGFRMHIQPTDGLPRNVGGHVVDMLFPYGSNASSNYSCNWNQWENNYYSFNYIAKCAVKVVLYN